MVEMKEIKPSLFTRLKGFFLLHPVAVAIIAVIFAIMFFGGCEKALAEEVPADYPVGGIPQYARDYIVTTYFSDSTDSFKQSIYTAFNISSQFLFTEYSDHDCALAVIVKYGTFVWSNGCGNPTINTPTGTYNFTYNSNTFHGISRITSNQQYGYNSRYLTYSSGDIMVYYFFKINNTFYSQYLTCNGLYRDKGSYGYIYYGRANSNINISKQEASGNGTIISYGDVYCFSALNSTFWIEHPCLIKSNYQNIIPSYTDDSRLKFAIIDDTSNGKTLMTDIRDFVSDFPIHDSSHSSVYLDPESITIGYTVNGVLKSITLDSNNSSIRSKYIFETPLSVFDYSESDDVVLITTCDFTIVGAAQGDSDLTTHSYKVSCDFPLKQVVDPIDKGSNQYANNVNGDTTSLEVSQGLNYLVTFREGYGLDFDEFSDIKFPDYYTYADVYLYNNQAAYSYLMDNIFSVNSVAYIIQNIANNENDVITQIGLFLDDSNYGQYYDVIVFDWVQENSSSIIHTYFYFETLSGRNKATTQIVRVLQEDVNNIKVNSAAIFTAVDNLENESLEFFNAKLAIDNDILDWLRTIDYSINGINIPEPDYSDITSRLNYIMDKLSIIANHSSLPSEDDTVSEAIAYFKSHSLNDLPIQSVFDDNKLSIWMAGKVHSWLQGSDSQTTKTSLLNDAFETLTSLYDSLTNESDFFGNMEKYLLSLRGGGIQDRDGLYFSRFFQNSFNPDSYDGGSL